jgi:4-hydroxybenzoate polyprenyltransferase
LFGWVVSGQSLTEYHILAWLWWWLWMMAWHTFSAIPDIEPDTKWGIATTATVLWEQSTLLYCFVVWLLAFVCFFPLIWYWILPGLVVFCWFCLTAYMLEDTYRVYKMIPWIIPFLGTFYFWVLIFI